jgi:hypothetical protein
MIRLISVLVVLVVAGCATTASPSLIGNHYYMMGDSKCLQGRFLSETRMMCLDKNGNDTGYRDGMTSEQLQSYQQAQAYNQYNQQVQMQQLSQQLQQTAQAFQNASQQIQQQSQQYVAPQVQPLTPQGGYGATTYRRAGNTVLGSDGSSCQVIGQSILCSDGRKCQLVGQNLICN